MGVTDYCKYNLILMAVRNFSCIENLVRIGQFVIYDSRKVRPCMEKFSRHSTLRKEMTKDFRLSVSFYVDNVLVVCIDIAEFDPAMRATGNKSAVYP